ncbi:hypothetical protein H6P81_016657 [Aristolochia fimbriata]|uniref:Uncharacterized protein n=1 Tax=Aristolochia fimbriata TaxID=158543 RepID=A0AAV7ECQ8_ARIFI|nr:hypothetical protein H6P81_016657 [Aristolochia fimbriata]
MKGIGRLATPSPAAKQAVITSSHFSTFSNSGGRGRGRGSGLSGSGRSTEDSDSIEDDASTPPPGLGHGRGKPTPSSSILPSFSSWISGITPSAGRGLAPLTDSESAGSLAKKPIFFNRASDSGQHEIQFVDSLPDKESSGILPVGISEGLSGVGRGKLTKPSTIGPKPQEENRHLRHRSAPMESKRTGVSDAGSSQQLTREEAVKKAVEILGRGGEGGRGRGGGLRGRGGGRGRGFRGRGGRGGIGRSADADDDFATGLYLGENADGERLAMRLGEQNMSKLTEAFEEMSWRVLPSPMDDAYLDALHTNNLIEYEPEYLMGDFESNPDIDEKPPIPLRDALEKMKPFLMEYEGIKSQEEWEEIIEELMERLPVFQELIDYYSGPDTVTAKQQQDALEQVAKSLPDHVPSSVKRFTDRAVLSLQSNPGWGWEKKYKFMDKLVREVRQQYE